MRSPRVNFQLAFYEGNREKAQQAADKEHRGNLTAYINGLIVKDSEHRERRSKKKA